MSGFEDGRPFAQKMPRTALPGRAHSPQAVDRLGRERDQPPGAEKLRRPRDRARLRVVRVNAHDLGVHGRSRRQCRNRPW